VNVPAGQDRAEVLAVYGFGAGRGDCAVQAATFYYMAKVLGYNNFEFVEAKIVTAGNKETLKVTKTSPHAWVEKVSGGKRYFFDPNAAYQKRKTNASYKTDATTYNFQFGAKGTYWYYDSHGHTFAA
jgi:hypothetical protein